MKTARWLMVGALLGFLGSTASSCGPTSKCGPGNCPFGCCDASGSCQPGMSDALCGAGGALCGVCSFPDRCQLGTCRLSGGSGGGSASGGGGGTTGGGGGSATGGGGAIGLGGGGGPTGGGGAACGPGNCSGCCGASGCVPTPFNTSNTTCGTSGNACLDCAASGATCNASLFACVAGSGGGGGGLSCTPQNCNGCCRFGTCVPPPNNANNSTCGSGGLSCTDCTTNARTCNPTTFSCVGTGTGGGGGSTGGGGGSTGGGIGSGGGTGTGGGTGGAGGGFAGGDTCASPALLPGPGMYVDSTANALDDYYVRSTDPGCANSSNSGSGPDKVYRITVPGGEVLNVTVTPAGWDATINLFDSAAACFPSPDSGVAVCLAGGDDPEELSWTNFSPSPVNVYLVVDAFSVGASGDITIEYSFSP